MADTVVSFLLENVAQLLKQEASMLLGVGDQIKSLYVELIQINQFLRNSKGKREMVKELVSLIRNVAHEAEDVIDTFVVNMAKHKKRNTLEKFWHSFERTTMLRSVAKDIESIKNEIATIYGSREKYGIENKEAGDDSHKRITLDGRRSQVEEDEVVSFVNDAKTVMEMLSKGSRHRDVVSIVGMGGLGKTTLAKKIYNDNFVKKRFDCRAWVYVSQEFRTRELLLNILQSVMPSTDDISKMNDEKLAEELRKFLDDKRYLIVLDDVWDIEVWNGIQKAFPENMSGCRVLITSRIKEVALHASSSPPYFLPLLGKDDSWELFSKKAFRGDDCPPELEKDGRQIAYKCNGLPLAIVVVAGLLAKRDRELRTWSQMAANVSWYLSRDPEKCLDVLALSYEELPPYLKPCFLYFGVFPEDFEVPARQLIRLWIAEGFIEHDERRKVEDAAEEYLEELIDRSLIMVVRRRSDGGIKSCCIHDLLRDLSIYEGVRENFLTVHTDQVFISSSSTSTTSITARPRRLSIHCSASRYISSTPCDSSRVRSLLCFGGQDELTIQKFHSLYKGFRLLRVLDLGSTVIFNVPTQVEKLIHLRYLRTNAPHLREIPSSISNLPNLQTLDLRESEVVYFTPNFWDMQQLRHLFLSGDCDIPYNRTRYQAKPMLNLQTLSTVNCSVPYLEDSESNPVFPNLTKVGLKGSHTLKINFLRSLKTLKCIGLIFRDSFVPSEFSSSSVTKVTFKRTYLKSSAFAILGKIPNLQVLKLFEESVDDPHMDCKEGGFPKLQTLHLVRMDVNKWSMESGAMQSLRYLVINKCLDLTAIPKELKQVSTLRHIKASWCSFRLERSIRTTLGENVQYEFQGYKSGGWGNFTN